MGALFQAAPVVGWPVQQQQSAPTVIAAPKGTEGPQPPPTPKPVEPLGFVPNETPEERARRLARLNSILGAVPSGSGGSDAGGDGSGSAGGGAGDAGGTGGGAGGGGAAAP